MHPVLREILMEPVGWLAIGGSIVMVGIAFAVAMFVRKKVREEEKRPPRCAHRRTGARSRNRTGMALRPADFKSDASTSFAIRARG